MEKFTESHGSTATAFSPGFRRILAVDFDGVLHLDKGWAGAAAIEGPAVPGAIEWITQMVEKVNEEGKRVFDVRIFSSRCNYPPGIQAMQGWLYDQGLPPEIMSHIEFCREKPPAWLTIDDRCFRFEGGFPTAEWMLKFDSWHRHGVPVAVLDVQFLRELAEGVDKYARAGETDPAILRLTAEECRRLRGIADWIEGIHHVRGGG